MFKKLFSIACCGLLAIATGCTADQIKDSKSEVVIKALNKDGEAAEITVPSNPEKIAVLDMALLDIVDSLGVGDRVVAVPKTSVDYLKKYGEDEKVKNAGTVKEVDMEALMEAQPDVIFIGGRLSSQYEALEKIAPVVYLSNDYKNGIVTSVKNNAAAIASIFGKESEAKKLTDAFDARIAKIVEASKGKTAIVGLVTSSSFNTLGNDSRGSIIGMEAGFENIATDVDSTHGNESSFELLVKKDPDYIFVIDRDSAINKEGAQLAKDVMDNELVQKTKAYKNNHIVYLTSTVWYLAEGGITAMDTMLKDIEQAIL